MSFGRIIFNFNPLNRHYLYPPFFFQTEWPKRKKLPFIFQDGRQSDHLKKWNQLTKCSLGYKVSKKPWFQKFSKIPSALDNPLDYMREN